jgi:hypothetical protein
MDTDLGSHFSAPETILNLIKGTFRECRQSPTRLWGFVRGFEIGISTLQGERSAFRDSMSQLQERSLRLSKSRDDFQLGVALGINLVADIASTLFHPATAMPS